MTLNDIKKTIDALIITLLPSITNLIIKSNNKEVIDEGMKCLETIQEEVGSIVSLPFDNVISMFQV